MPGFRNEAHPCHFGRLISRQLIPLRIRPTIAEGNAKDVPAVDLSRAAIRSAALTDAHSKHSLNPKFDENLKVNLDIWQPKGAIARGGDLDDVDGENAMEGVSKNDAGPLGRVKPERKGHTNR